MKGASPGCSQLQLPSLRCRASRFRAALWALRTAVLHIGPVLLAKSSELLAHLVMEPRRKRAQAPPLWTGLLDRALS